MIHTFLWFLVLCAVGLALYINLYQWGTHRRVKMLARGMTRAIFRRPRTGVRRRYRGL